MTLPADSFIRNVEPGGRPQGLPWLAIVAAALLHAIVLLWLFLDWSHPARAPAVPDVVPVKIVFAPPPPPPAAAPPAPKPAAPLAYRESGPDQRTTAPPSAEATAPEPAAPPPAAPAQAKPEAEAPPEKPTPAPQTPASPPEKAKPIPHKEVARIEPQKKEAPKPLAPHPGELRRLDVEPGERLETGDPYLNQLHALIERHRVYPRIIGQFGLPVEGTATYDVALDRSGKIIAMKLERSSGVAGIDQAVGNMIRSSLPFPPLPPDYPDEVAIVVAIRLFPPS